MTIPKIIVDKKRELIDVVGLLGTMIFAIGLHTICGYIVHHEEISAWVEASSTMALSTAVGLLITGTALSLVALILKIRTSNA